MASYSLRRQQSDQIQSPCPVGSDSLFIRNGWQIKCETCFWGGDLEKQTSVSFEDCMAKCSTKPGCVGVAYGFGAKDCWMKSSIPETNDFTIGKCDNNGFHSALILPKDVLDDCPTLVSPLEEQNFKTQTYCNTRYSSSDRTIAAHATSLSECIKIGLDQKMAVVSYSSKMDSDPGYWNCYPNPGGNFSNFQRSENMDTAWTIPESDPDSSSSSTSAPIASPGASTSNNHHMSAGAIAGIVIGCIVALLLVIVTMMLLRYRKHHKASQASNDADFTKVELETSGQRTIPELDTGVLAVSHKQQVPVKPLELH